MGSEDFEVAPTTDFALRFASEQPGAAEFGWAVQAVDLAITAGAWIELAAGENDELAERLDWDASRNEARRRLFPGFASKPVPSALRFMQDLDPSDPLDVGVAMALNVWLREALRTDPDAYAAAVGGATIEKITHESPIVLILAIPITVKVGSVAAVGVSAVFKGVQGYFSARQTKAKIGVLKAEKERVEAETKRTESLARAERTKLYAESEEIRSRTRIREREAKLREGIAEDLQARLPETDPERIDDAARIGAAIAQTTISELDENPAVKDLRRRDR